MYVQVCGPAVWAEEPDRIHAVTALAHITGEIPQEVFSLKDWSGSVQPLHLHRQGEEPVSRPAIKAAGHILKGVADIPRSSPQHLLFDGLDVIWMKEGLLVIVMAAVRTGCEGLARCATRSRITLSRRGRAFTKLKYSGLADLARTSKVVHPLRTGRKRNGKRQFVAATLLHEATKLSVFER
jgi:hypothetical protein